MVKKLDAFVAPAIALAAAATTTATTAIQPQRKLLMIEKDDITGQVPLEVMSITFCFPGCKSRSASN